MPDEQIRSAERLLIRGLNWIGDAVMSVPTLWKIRAAAPSARITVYAPDWCADIYRICPAVDSVVRPPPKRGAFGFRSEWQAAKRLRSERFEAAIVLPNSFHSALTISMAGIPHRFGYRTDGRGMLLTFCIPPDKSEIRHTVLYYQPLLEALGVPWEKGSERFDLDLSAETLSETEEVFIRRGVDLERELIGISPGAAWGPSKRWPAEHFAAAVAALCPDDNRQAVFFGSPADRELIDRITSSISTRAVSLAGAFDKLRHLIAAVRRCRLLITNDSGPMHIAAALGVPLVAIFGPTDERISGPWTTGRGKSTILRDPACRPCYNPRCDGDGRPCLARIAPEQVVESAEKLLESNG
jgi:heptosyltransferase-2